jgi:O-antigen ligase
MADLAALFRWLNLRFHLVFATVIAAGLMIAPMPLWGLLFYITIPALVVWRIAQGWRPPFTAPVTFGLTLIIWSLVTIISGYDPSGQGDSPWKWFADGVITLIFFLGWLMTAEQENGAEWLETGLVYGGAINAVLALIQHLILHPGGLRMRGWGIGGEPVLGASIIAVLFVLTLDRLLAKRGKQWVQACFICLFMAFLLQSGSRGPILAAATGALYLLAGQPRKIWIWITGAGAAVLVLLVLLEPSTIRQTIQLAVARGDDYHSDIWKEAVKLILQRPFIGYGSQARLPIVILTLHYPFPHNLYLSILFYTGIIGLLLFLGFVTSCFLQLGMAQRGRVALCLVPLITGLTDLSQIIKGPAAIWYILWVPFLLAIGTFLPKAPKAAPEGRVTSL